MKAQAGSSSDFGADTELVGGDGDDRLTADIAGVLDQTLVGGAGNDVLSLKAQGGDADTDLRGGDGDDRLTAGFTVGGGADQLTGRTRLDGDSGNDRIVLAITFQDVQYIYQPRLVALRGGDGNDVLGFSIAGLPANARDPLTAAATVLDGGAGNDRITGSVVPETLIDGLGRDTLAGGGGADVFRLAAGDEALDRITGFSGAASQGDKLDLTLFGADPDVAFAAGILSVDGEDVAKISGSFDPATDLILA